VTGPEPAAGQKRPLQNVWIEIGNAGLVRHNVTKNLAKIGFAFLLAQSEGGG
jgi:phenylalanyl-tRNA synthetase alpha subunit